MTVRTGRTRHALRLLAVGLLALATLSSCQVIGLLFGVTIGERIKDFSDGYTSGDYANLYKNFSTSTGQYDAMKSSSYWSGSPFDSADGPQPITSYSVKGSTVTGTFSNANADFAFTMQMQQQGFDWYILSLSMTLVSGSSTNNSYLIQAVQ